MSPKDLHEDLMRYYEFMVGKFPDRGEFKNALQETITPEELALFFLVPFAGTLSLEKLKRKAIRRGMTLDWVQQTLKRLCMEGVLMSYDTLQGRVVERGNPAFMSEQQVRKQEDSPRRRAYAGFMDAMIEGAASSAPNKTPYYRVLPVENSLTGAAHRQVNVDAVVPDPRQVLPLDIVSEMVKQETLIAVAECYCRKSKQVVGKGCQHPLETCMVFSTLAQTLIEAGIARPIDQAEALHILRECESAGLVHNVDNCIGQIKSICNCCACSCVLLKAVARGQTNAAAPSRYRVVFEPQKCQLKQACIKVCPTGTLTMQGGTLNVARQKCIGCGQCVSVCPEGALHLERRPKTGKLYRTNDELWGKIRQEAMVGIAVNKILGR